MPDSSRNFSQGTIRKIAIVHQAHFQAGGAATYESNLSDLARNITADSNFDLLELFPAGNGIPKQKRSQTGVSAKTHLYSKGFFQLVQILLHSFPMSRKFLKLLGFGSTQFELQLNKLGVNLVYFSSPNALALGIHTIPIITTVWDLGHRDLPNFPEFSSRGRWFFREFYYRKTIAKSKTIITDSVATGEKLEKIYGRPAGTWVSIGLLPKELESSRNFDLLPKQNYVIYPAQKWKHKNHHVLYAALQILRKQGVEVHLVETGADKGYASHLKKIARNCDVQDLILDYGFVHQSELALLMRNSKGLVMPSRLGPTNLPPLEAVMLGVPVAVSDVHQFDEFAGMPLTVCGVDAPLEWAEAIRKMIQGELPSLSKFEFCATNASEKLRRVLHEDNLTHES